MNSTYQTLYAYLVGQVDEVITAIETKRDTVPAAELLEQTRFCLEHALREAEERFLRAE